MNRIAQQQNNTSTHSALQTDYKAHKVFRANEASLVSEGNVGFKDTMETKVPKVKKVQKAATAETENVDVQGMTDHKALKDVKVFPNLDHRALKVHQATSPDHKARKAWKELVCKA